MRHSEHAYENTAGGGAGGAASAASGGGGGGGGRTSAGRGLFANHRRTPSNVSNSSATHSTNSSSVNPSFRLEDELEPAPASTERRGVAFDLAPSASSMRPVRQNSLEPERPGTLVRSAKSLVFFL